MGPIFLALMCDTLFLYAGARLRCEGFMRDLRACPTRPASRTVTQKWLGERKPEPAIAQRTRGGTSPGSPGRTTTATGRASMPYRKKLTISEGGAVMGSMIPWAQGPRLRDSRTL